MFSGRRCTRPVVRVVLPGTEDPRAEAESSATRWPEFCPAGVSSGVNGLGARGCGLVLADSSVHVGSCAHSAQSDHERSDQPCEALVQDRKAEAENEECDV